MVFELRFVPNFKHLTLYEQALAMHDSDIIITTHGAQLTNLAYIKKCTAIVELFPKNYYLYFYQSLTSIAGGIHYEGYLSGSNRWKDTLPGISNYTVRNRDRSKPILASPESILFDLPVIKSAIFD